MTHLIYDLEIKKGILGKGEKPHPGIEYCAGWQDHANMGISVLGAMEWPSRRPHVFWDDNRGDFFLLVRETIASGGKLISFNGLGFDNKVILAAWGQEVWAQACYDLLRETWVASGLGPEFKYPSHVGFTLDAMCRANGIPTKTGNGAHAPVLYQTGKFGELVDYCLNDVFITGLLFDAAQSRTLCSPKDANAILTYPKV